ncbi:hypothetical protein Pla52o_53830 [Novipirellula galeiformis]|uniref:Uncharacterized protein n=1 Tax=Novipirellula galeiformis TaxID=2528004 RepID=A0A5C6BZB0_9BACT|nr:hypothetical protein Pla52o_53830 [Novipirellula galeiformis]
MQFTVGRNQYAMECLGQYAMEREPAQMVRSEPSLSDAIISPKSIALQETHRENPRLKSPVEIHSSEDRRRPRSALLIFILKWPPLISRCDNFQ